MSDWHRTPWRVTSPGCNVEGSKMVTFDDVTKTINVHPGAFLWGTFSYTGPDTVEAVADGITHTITCIPGWPRKLQCLHLEDDRPHPPRGSCSHATVSWTALEGTGMRT